jgi:HSP20 family molecular chaperone IbpA
MMGISGIDGCNWRGGRYPFNSIGSELEDMRAELYNMFQLAPYRGRFLPPGGVTDRMLPAMQGEFPVDVREHDDEVIVVADLPGVEKDDVSLQIRTRETLRSRVNAKVRKRKNLKATLSGYKDQCNGLLQCPQMWQ